MSQFTRKLYPGLPICLCVGGRVPRTGCPAATVTRECGASCRRSRSCDMERLFDIKRKDGSKRRCFFFSPFCFCFCFISSFFVFYFFIFLFPPLLIYICNFHVLSHSLLIFICKLHWNTQRVVSACRNKLLQ